METSLYISRVTLEGKEGWRGYIFTMPFIQFPAGWKVSIIPPFAGAIARFRVQLPSGTVKSVYFDAFDRLGCMDEPYWEVHPYQGDCGRCFKDEIKELLEMIADESMPAPAAPGE